MILLENMDYQAGVEALLRSGYGVKLEQNHINESPFYTVTLVKDGVQYGCSANDPKLALIEAYHAAETPEPVVAEVAPAADAAPVEASVAATATIQAPVSVVVTDHDQFFGQHDAEPAEDEHE